LKINGNLSLSTLFSTNIGELYDRKFSKLLKKYDEIAKNRQKTLSRRYKK